MKSSKIVFFLAILFISSAQIFSLPRFSLRYKDRCSSCHVNPTGGMMRTEDGFEFGKNVLSMISPRDKDFPLTPKLSDNISFGFDYRSQFLYSQEKKRTDFQDMTGSLYLGADVAPKINVLARYDFVNIIWEWYATAKILPNDSYIKVGSFIPDFGIHLDDHTAYTRGGDYGLLFSTGAIQGLIFNPFFTVTGIELGANLSKNALLTASVGRSKQNGIFSTDPTWTTRFEYTPSIEKIRLLFGGSYADTKMRGASGFHDSQLYGAFAGIGYDRFTLMGEYDLANDYILQNSKSSALMLEAAYQLMIGLEAVVRYDRFDPNIDISNDTFSHLVLGFEFYPYSFVEVKPQFRINMSDPNQKSNSVVVQFHFWY